GPVGGAYARQPALVPSSAPFALHRRNTPAPACSCGPGDSPGRRPRSRPDRDDGVERRFGRVATRLESRGGPHGRRCTLAALVPRRDRRPELRATAGAPPAGLPANPRGTGRFGARGAPFR